MPRTRIFALSKHRVCFLGGLASVLTIIGCFDPSYPAGRPCSEQGACPGDLVCDPSTNSCVGSIEEGGRSDVDASVDSGTSEIAPDAAPTVPCIEGDLQAQDPETESCYVFLQARGTWTDGQAACENAGPDLLGASITSPMENEFVSAFVPSLDFYTGGNDLDVEGTFTWSDEEPFTFENWRAGEPNNSEGREDCLVIQGNLGSVWDDRSCSEILPILCERADR